MILAPQKDLKSCIPPISLQRIFENHAYHLFCYRKFLKIVHSPVFDAGLFRIVSDWSLCGSPNGPVNVSGHFKVSRSDSPWSF